MARVVMHVDMDCFFVQCAQQTDATLQGKAIAVYQHGDIISVSYEAQVLGVKKHASPTSVAELFGAAVTLVSVPCLPGTTKVTYRPYQDVSDAIFRTIQKVVGPQSILEEASIDECYVDVTARCQPEADDDGEYRVWETAAALCTLVREAVEEATGIQSSCAVAKNKLLAKVGSMAAKPNGQLVIHPNRDIFTLMKDLPLSKLPGYGRLINRKESEIIASILDKASVGHVLRFGVDRLKQHIGNKAAIALYAACNGVDDSPVMKKQPPKSCSVSMTLTPIPHTRVASLLRILGFLVQDMNSKLERDSQKHGRWPKALRLSYRMVDEKEKAVAGLTASRYAMTGPGKDRSQLDEELLTCKLYEQFLAAVEGSWRMRWVSLTASFGGIPSQRSVSAPHPSARGGHGHRPLESFFAVQIKRSTSSLAVPPAITKTKKKKMSVLDMLQRPKD